MAVGRLSVFFLAHMRLLSLLVVASVGGCERTIIGSIHLMPLSDAFLGRSPDVMHTQKQVNNKSFS
jgi:hypothetical protein